MGNLIQYLREMFGFFPRAKVFKPGELAHCTTCQKNVYAEGTIIGDVGSVGWCPSCGSNITLIEPKLDKR